MLFSLLHPISTTSDKKTDSVPILFIIGVIIAVIAIVGFICSVVSTATASKENNNSASTGKNTASGENDNAVAKKKGHPILIVFFVILAIVSVVLIVKSFSSDSNSSLSPASSSSSSSSSSSTPTLLSRNANNSDITIQDTPLNLGNLGQDIVFVANSNISGLVLTFRFYDKNDSLVTTKTKELGSVTKGQQYTVSFSMTDFSLSDNFKITSVSTAVTSGKVSYLG